MALQNTCLTIESVLAFKLDLGTLETIVPVLFVPDNFNDLKLVKCDQNKVTVETLKIWCDIFLSALLHIKTVLVKFESVACGN